ncbi:MAG TPA: hypothetical protein VKA64_04265, partial [Gammaproteobacteria bacterium]|nr:hypothetical protein [Gammaproteobacteria bacterium]
MPVGDQSDLTALPGFSVESPPDEAGWLETVEGLLDQEQPFLAYDLAVRGQQRYPTSLNLRLLQVLALLRGHSTAAALPIMEALEPELLGALPIPSQTRLAAIHRLIWELEGRRNALQEARRLYRKLYETTGHALDAVEAAALSLQLGDREAALRLSEAIRDNPDPLARGQARLILGDGEQARSAFEEARHTWGRDYRPVVAALKSVQALAAAGVDIPEAVTSLLRPPSVVIFGGQPLDPADSDEPVLPPAKLPALKEAIEDKLQVLDARIGYSSLACGADLLFVEALLERGGEAHIILPCTLEDFVEARVAYAGPEWVERFERALSRAATVTYATRERYLGHAILLRYANTITTGIGWLRAELLRTEPELLVAWDYRVSNQPGSASDFMDHWPDIARLHLIDLDELEATGPDTPLDRPRAGMTVQPERVIRAMLFADVVGFSTLGEEYLPNFLNLLERIRAFFDATGNQAELIEAWGDALYVVMPNARALLAHAFRLRDAFLNTDHRDLGLPEQLNVR